MLRGLAFGLFLATLGCLGLSARPVGAVGVPAAPVASVQASISTAEEPVDATSPRATVSAYLALCRRQNYVEAAKFLDVPKERRGDAPRLARQLKAVLDRHAWIDVETLSPSDKGNPDDGLPLVYEGIAKIPTTKGQVESVRLYKRGARQEGPAWVFSRTTVDRIDSWYNALEQTWALEHLPLWMLRSGPRELLVWQWMALPLLIGVSWLLGSLISRLARVIFGALARRTKSPWDDEVVIRLGGPATLVFTLVLLHEGMPWLALYAPATSFVQSFVKGGVYFSVWWGLSRLIDVWGKSVIESPWALEHAAANSLIPIGVRVGKIIVIVIAVVALVSSMGYPAASLVAGLGVGGLAIALAAQKTLENLFGAFTLGFDQPFRVGDFVKVEDFLGNVETIGLRSTKIRTLDRTLITIPNGKLSEMRLESYTARDRLRLACNLGLVYGTSTEQMKQVLSEIEQLLRSHPKIWSDGIVVRFKEFGESALVLELQAWFSTSDYEEFQGIRQETYLGIMAIVESAGTEFAFPTRTVHVVTQP